MITQRVLIADGDSHVQAFARRVLDDLHLQLVAKGEGVCFTTECVSTDDDAVLRLQHDPPDVVVLEHWAPGLNGVEILKSRRDYSHNTTAIVAATRPSIPAAVEATKLGAYEFLAKPLTEQRLREVFTEATAQRLGAVVSTVCSSGNVIENATSILSRIPAAIAHLASTAVSLHW